MLQKVTILIQQNYINILQRLSDSLQEHAIEVAVVAVPVGHDNCDFAWTQPDAADCDAADKETLYITDSESAYRELCRQGKYVLPYRHDGNRDMGFAGALYIIEKIEEIGYETVDMVYRRLAGLPWEIFTTKRCIVRETIEEDVDSFYRIYAEPEITKYMEDLYADRDEEIAYIRNYREKVYGYYGYGMWTVLTRDGTIIGRAGINWREGFDMPELGFVIGVPWQRRGYAYEVCEAVLEYAHNELGFTQIQALVMEGNDKSESLCNKLGFQFVDKITIDNKAHARLVWQAEMPYCVFIN